MGRIEDIGREDMAWEDKASEGKDAVAVARHLFAMVTTPGKSDPTGEPQSA